jgi:type IV pilus assembly protein PilB
MKITQDLFGEGIISEQQKTDIEQEIMKTGKTEEEIILEKKLTSEEDLFERKSKIFKIILKKVKPEDVFLETLELIPEEAAYNYKMVPLAKKEGIIQIGMVYPESIPAQNALRFLARQENFKFEVYLITLENLNNLLKQHRTLKSETKRALEEFKKEQNDGRVTNIVLGEKSNDSKTIVEDAPIIKMVLVLLRHAIEGNASDIHIEPSRDKLNIRFRQDGILYPSLFLPLNVHMAVTTRIKIIAGLKIDENRVPQDGRFSAKINNKDVDFRVATFPTLYGEKVELRILDSNTGVRSFEDLGLNGRNLEVIKDAISKPYGMVLATGPTGSGKSTTLYSLLRILNKDSVNIVTLEDPVEYSIAGVNQSQIKPEIGYGFSQGLRQILRQDPNIIMVGEIRDEETASLAVNAALTGHIVLSSLHTNSATGVVSRLIDMGIKPFLIPSTLRIAISQRLVRNLCEFCKEKVKPSEKIQKYLQEKLKAMPAHAKKDIDISNGIYIYEIKGCEKCGLKGYSGRSGLYEVLAMTDELAEMILKNPSEQEIFKLAQRQGMLTMEQEGILKVLRGQTTMQEVSRATEEK